MKKIIFILLVLVSLFSCDVVLQSAKDIGEMTSSSTSLSQQEIASGLKEALNVGISNAVNVVSQTNGFYKNPEIAIPFPQEAIKVKEICEKAGLKSQVEQFEEKINRAAEEAAKGAKDVFVEAIKQMTINDAVAILKGNDDAATQYLKRTTSKKLYDKFYPVVVNSTDKIMLAKYWTPLTDKYNTVASLAGGEKINTDLNAYITNEALDGLFVMVAKEEKKIRTDPGARINDILKKVFGSNMNPYNSK